ncbi:AAA family ATPase [Schaalia suimastitidis]|uniref:AAA family ATPase n=1 Tax=Schaalia suimastitidis TaxID=121163 RepID=UPI00040BCFE1
MQPPSPGAHPYATGQAPTHPSPYAPGTPSQAAPSGAPQSVPTALPAPSGLPTQAPLPTVAAHGATATASAHAAAASTPPTPVLDDAGLAARAALVALRAEIGKAVVGQDNAVTGIVIALVAGGHALLEGVPGVAKTLLVRTVATALDLDMSRVQFTPDLMPADITGSLVWDGGTSSFEFRPGPVFTNLLLADEINRTPPKTQSALLEAMEERQVSVDGHTHRLDDPFMVIATQNPVEYEGTYPLPEAQLDRFLVKLELPLPARDEEIEVISRHQAGFDPLSLPEAGVRAVAGPQQIRAARQAAAKVEVAPEVLGYIVDLVRATRTSPSLRLGVSPRGATALLRTCRVWAFLQGRAYVTPDDVKAMAVATLAHRVGLRAEAELEGITARAVIEGLLAQVPVPR